MTTDLLPIPAHTAPVVIDHERLQLLLSRMLATSGRFSPDGVISEDAHLQLQACANYYHYQNGRLHRGRLVMRMDQAAATWWTMVTLEQNDPRNLTREEWFQALGRLSQLICITLMPRIQAMDGQVMVEVVDNFRSPVAQGIWVGVSCEEGLVGVVLEPSIAIEFPLHCI